MPGICHMLLCGNPVTDLMTRMGVGVELEGSSVEKSQFEVIAIMLTMRI